MAVLFAVITLLEKAGIGQPPRQAYFFTIGLDPMVRAGYMAMVACYLTLKVRDLELLGIGVLAVMLELVIFAQRPFTWTMAERLGAIGVGFGWAAAFGMLLRAGTSSGPMRERALGHFYVGTFLPLFPTVSVMGLYLVAKANPLVMDKVGYALDGALGFQPAFVLGTLLLDHPWLYRLSLFVYGLLPLFMIGCILVRLRWPERGYNNPVPALIGAGILGLLLYNVMPMVGIDFLFGPEVFPRGTPPVLREFSPAQVDLNYPRSCLPSLHLAWILIVFCSVRRAGKLWLGLGLAAVLFTFLGAMSPRVGHYWIDMVAAFPLVLLLQGLTTIGECPGRKAAIGFGAGSLAFFLVAVRWGYPVLLAAPALFVLLQLILIGGSVWLEQKLCSR